MFSAMQSLLRIFPKLEDPDVWMIPPLHPAFLYLSKKAKAVTGLMNPEAAVWWSTSFGT